MELLRPLCTTFSGVLHLQVSGRNSQRWNLTCARPDKFRGEQRGLTPNNWRFEFYLNTNLLEWCWRKQVSASFQMPNLKVCTVWRLHMVNSICAMPPDMYCSQDLHLPAHLSWVKSHLLCVICNCSSSLCLAVTLSRCTGSHLEVRESRSELVQFLSDGCIPSVRTEERREHRLFPLR